VRAWFHQGQVQDQATQRERSQASGKPTTRRDNINKRTTEREADAAERSPILHAGDSKGKARKSLPNK
jgi:hypothetical protein